MMPTFTEEWFSEASQDALASLVRAVKDIPGRIIEIGSWEGRSTIAMANATDCAIHAVDTWAGSPGEISAELAGERDVFATWKANVKEATEGNVFAHRVGWREYREQDDSPVALLFIDAEHTYREVADTIEAFLPLMSPGGIICGDDAHHPPIIQAVAERFPDAYRDQSLWVAPLPGPDLAGDYERLCSTPSDIYEHLAVFFGLVGQYHPEHVIELGTRTGVSTIAWLHALEQHGGRLTSVDINPRPPIGHFDHWTFIRGDDLDTDVYSQLDPAEIVFIDTSHLYDQTVKELNLYRWLVKPGGIMVLHDTELARPEGAPARPAFPVKTAIVEFCEANGFEWNNRPNCWGLGTIKVV
jgi:predicted O-methyltransferase YrrM